MLIPHVFTNKIRYKKRARKKHKKMHFFENGLKPPKHNFSFVLCILCLMFYILYFITRQIDERSFFCQKNGDKWRQTKLLVCSQVRKLD